MNKTKTLSELTSESYPEIFGDKKELLLLVCQELKCADVKNLYARFAVKNRGKIRFAFAFEENPIGAHIMKFLDVESEELPVVRLLKFEYRNILKFKGSLQTEFSIII